MRDDTAGTEDLGACGSLDGGRRSRGSLEDRIGAALCKAYAREDRRLHGAPVAIVQALVTRGLAYMVSRGRYERYALSVEGERLAADLTSNLLERRGRHAPSAPQPLPGALSVKAAVYDKLVDFLDGSLSSAVALTLDFPAEGALSSDLRVKIERCGPGKLLLHVVKPRAALAGTRR